MRGVGAMQTDGAWREAAQPHPRGAARRGCGRRRRGRHWPRRAAARRTLAMGGEEVERRGVARQGRGSLAAHAGGGARRPGRTSKSRRTCCRCTCRSMMAMGKEEWTAPVQGRRCSCMHAHGAVEARDEPRRGAAVDRGQVRRQPRQLRGPLSKVVLRRQADKVDEADVERVPGRGGGRGRGEGQQALRRAAALAARVADVCEARGVARPVALVVADEVCPEKTGSPASRHVKEGWHGDGGRGDVAVSSMHARAPCSALTGPHGEVPRRVRDVANEPDCGQAGRQRQGIL